MKKNSLIIIPARGGSKGIPRKNLRPIAGNPLIYYVIKTSLELKIDGINIDVVVTSEDEEILEFSKRYGSLTHKRPSSLSNDKITLDPVIEDYVNFCNKKYDFIITIQPTSPLLKSSTLKSAILKFISNEKIDTLISVIEDTHLSWSKIQNKYVPNYEKRKNRQELTPNFKETGSFLISRVIINNTFKRIGKNIDLYIIDKNESTDIDNFEDWSVCEYFLKKKKILFNIIGNKSFGLGHVYNTLSIANEILNHELIFLFDSNSKLGFNKVKSENYNALILKKDSDLIEQIKIINPDIVINDCLDTSKSFMNSLKKLKIKTINFEDLGEGSKKSNLLINAMYKKNNHDSRGYYGLKYFILKNEFYNLKISPFRKNVQKVLITYGGVDPNDLTYKTLESIYGFCNNKKIKIDVVLGLGYTGDIENLKYTFPNVKIVQDVKFISNYINSSDLVISSAGRTTFEIASLHKPAIILCQNKREITHAFCYEKNGFLNLGLGTETSLETIVTSLKTIIENQDYRFNMHNLMKKTFLMKGKKNVMSLIKTILDE